MRLSEVLSALGLKVAPATWVQHWDAIAPSLRVGGAAKLMNAQVIVELSERLRMPSECKAALEEHLRLFDERPALDLLLQFCHRLLFVEHADQNLGKWPELDDKVVPHGNMLYVYLFLTGRENMLRRHGKLGVSPAITDDTLSDVFVWMQDYHDKTGFWGTSVLGWIGGYMVQDRLFKLGRLQFDFNKFNPPFRGYRNVRTGDVIVLAREGRKYRCDGQFEGTDWRLEANGPWLSGLETVDGELRGHLAHPDGYVLQAKRNLKLSEWEAVFDQGEPSIGVHIPGGEPLTPEGFQASIQQAIEFFPKHFPAYPFKAMWCHSWMMDGQLKQHLPPDSNLVKFLDEFYLLPYPNTSGWQHIERIFGRKTIDLATVEAKTSLQRAVLDHMRQGGAWHCAAGVIFPQSYVPGENAYRQPEWFEKYVNAQTRSRAGD